MNRHWFSFIAVVLPALNMPELNRLPTRHASATGVQRCLVHMTCHNRGGFVLLLSPFQSQNPSEPLRT